MTITLGGWLFLILAWGSIIGLSLFCMIKVLRSEKDKEK